MNNIFLLAKRELGYYLNTIWGYAILAIILVIDGILFNTFAMGANTERYSTDVLQDFFFFSSGTTMIAGYSSPCDCSQKNEATELQHCLRLPPSLRRNSLPESIWVHLDF